MSFLEYRKQHGIGSKTWWLQYTAPPTGIAVCPLVTISSKACVMNHLSFCLLQARASATILRGICSSELGLVPLPVEFFIAENVA